MRREACQTVVELVRRVVELVQMNRMVLGLADWPGRPQRLRAHQLSAPDVPEGDAEHDIRATPMSTAITTRSTASQQRSVSVTLGAGQAIRERLVTTGRAGRAKYCPPNEPLNLTTGLLARSCLPRPW
jgi:hypothetical protein